MKALQNRPEIITAYAWQSGLIGFTSAARPVIPEGTLPIVTGPKSRVRKIITTRARHSRFKPTRLLVPGLPEYSAIRPTKKTQLEIFQEWQAWVLKNEKTKPNAPLTLA